MDSGWFQISVSNLALTPRLDAGRKGINGSDNVCKLRFLLVIFVRSVVEIILLRLVSRTCSIIPCSRFICPGAPGSRLLWLQAQEPKEALLPKHCETWDSGYLATALVQGHAQQQPNLPKSAFCPKTTGLRVGQREVRPTQTSSI